MNKHSPVATGLEPVDMSNPELSCTFRETAVTYRGIEPTIVEKAMITSNSEDTNIIKLLLRQTRRPEVGDKFSSRHGQKGVIGLIVQQEDFVSLMLLAVVLLSFILYSPFPSMVLSRT